MKHFYVYYSYEEYGRGYIGKRECKCLPEKDINYFGSFKDKYFKPTQKIILETFDSIEEALESECVLHEFYQVDKNPHFVNKAKQTSKKFYCGLQGKNNPMYGKTGKAHPAYGYKHTEENRKKISESQMGEKNHMYGRYGEKNHMYGRKHTKEARKIMSERQMGEKNHTYGKTCITNGIRNKYILPNEIVPEGWYIGRTLNRMWINNGVLNKFHNKLEIIPEGWYVGRVKSSKN